MLIGGALANALAFTGSSYLFHRLSADNIDSERFEIREPVSSNFYTPTDEQHYRELGFIALSMIGIRGVLYYFES